MAELTSQELKNYGDTYGHIKVGDILVGKDKIYKINKTDAWKWFYVTNIKDKTDKTKIEAEDLKSYGKHISQSDSEYKKYIKPSKMSYKDWDKIKIVVGESNIHRVLNILTEGGALSATEQRVAKMCICGNGDRFSSAEHKADCPAYKYLKRMGE